MEYKNIGFKKIIEMNFIERINYLIDRTSKNSGKNYNVQDEESSYLDYVFELFYEMIKKF